MINFDGAFLDYSKFDIFFRDDFRNYANVNEMNFRTNPSTGKWYLDPPYDKDNYGWGQELFNHQQVSLLPSGGVRLTAQKIYPNDQQVIANFSDGTSLRRTVNYKSGILRMAPLGHLDPDSGQPVGSEFRTGFKYGLFEMRAKMPADYPGIWPTFWKFGNGVEIDTVDTLKEHPAKMIQSGSIVWSRMPNVNTDSWTALPNYVGETPLNFNTSSYYHKGDLVLFNSVVYQAKKLVRRVTFGNLSFKNKGESLQNRYNTYSVLWTPSEIAFFFNGYKIYSETNAYSQMGVGVTNLIVSLQMEEWAPKGSPQNPFTTHMDIDYVCVYKPKNYDPLTTVPEDFNFRCYEKTTLFNNLGAINDVAVTPNNYPITYYAKAASDLIVRQNGNKIYYRGNENRLHNFYWSDPNPADTDSTEKWAYSALNGNINNVAGDVVHSPTEERLFYRSKISNNKSGIGSFYFDTNTQIWVHENVSGNIDNVVGNLIVSPNGKRIYFRDSNKSLCFFEKTNNGWSYTPTLAGARIVEGDVIHSPTAQKIYYRGSDGHLWNLYENNGVWKNVL